MGVPLMRTKLWAYAIGAFFGGIAGALLRLLHRRRSSRRASTSTSPSSSSAWSSSAAWATSGASILGGADPLVPRPRGARQDRRAAQRGVDAVGIDQAIDDPEVQVRHLRRAARDHDAVPAGGADPERAPQGRVRGGRATDAVALRRPSGGWPTTPRATTSSRPSAIRKEFGGLVAVQRRRLHDPARLDRQPDRPERRRQDDVLQHAHRRLQADRRRRSSSTATTSRGMPPHEITQLGIGADVPEHPALPPDDGARERARRHARAGSRAASVGAILRTPAAAGARSAEAEPRGARAARVLAGCAGAHDELREEPALRRPAAARGRARARDRAEAAARSTSRPPA